MLSFASLSIYKVRKRKQLKEEQPQEHISESSSAIEPETIPKKKKKVPEDAEQVLTQDPVEILEEQREVERI